MKFGLWILLLAAIGSIGYLSFNLIFFEKLTLKELKKQINVEDLKNERELYIENDYLMEKCKGNKNGLKLESILEVVNMD